jgi:purine-binding chemotaxis protein CheW
MNLRGRVLPVLDLRRRLGLPPGEKTPRSRLMIVDLGDRPAGFIVDSVDRVLKVPPENVQQASAFATGFEGGVKDYISAVARLEGGNLMVVLDFTKILTRKERQALDQTRA